MTEEQPFVPKEGQIDFSKARWVPVLNCIVVCDDKILLVKRSESLRLYPGYWNGISGFLDDHKSLEEKAREELFEELGMPEELILTISPGKPFDVDAPEIGKTWIVHPVLVECDPFNIKLDFEASEYRWLRKEELKGMNFVPGFDQVLSSFDL